MMSAQVAKWANSRGRMRTNPKASAELDQDDHAEEDVEDFDQR